LQEVQGKGLTQSGDQPQGLYPAPTHVLPRVNRAYLKTTYRGVSEILETSEQLRTELGMKEKMPHYSTMAMFCERSAVMEILTSMLQRPSAAALRQGSQPVAIDATGLKTSKCQVWPLLQQSLSGQIKPPKLYAEASYDAEWVHGVCREEFSGRMHRLGHRREGQDVLLSKHQGSKGRMLLQQTAFNEMVKLAFGHTKRLHRFGGVAKELCQPYIQIFHNDTFSGS